ncbi:16S rRNA (cytosine(967)-C(5))-methyltransferase [Pseudanabaena sp. FACHB-2040]|uniref:16S rRNA (cytosine(967)-C(5))-methyltransferase n=1 Tax=Pseudanabaena sp. FACHB-2040 TaxID=2692859 RepID=UPI001687771B|nr:16S rRNA (cytosine(967)-C(5))-methyltransferase [Pseudanabaena sp. FACHB-2040]MBD2257753.1 16S rRNA (cytosine(967)-C(5))-methyltransferase [Pseudanabaena sp. FACHB-2040]
MLVLPTPPKPSARQLAYEVLLAVHKGAYADVALHRSLAQVPLGDLDRAFVTELVYGSVRRQRTLDTLIDQLGKKKAHQQPAEIRAILHLGLYQLRYLSTVPPSAAVNTSVDLVKAGSLSRLSGVVNGILRQYLRLQKGESDTPQDPLWLPSDPVAAVAVRHSYPDWIVRLWYERLGLEATEDLCRWFNQSPHIDLRVNRCQIALEDVEAAFAAAGVQTERLNPLPDALRLTNPAGSVTALPGYAEGWWSVQDASAQLVAYLVNPQPGEVIVDACAAPGGKATHLAELMGDQGTVWACDRTTSRLKKIKTNSARLQLNSLKTYTGDSRDLPKFHGQADRVLIDAPCSGLGTLHRHADARWRQSPETAHELVTLQRALLEEAARWAKPEATMVYATCTLNPEENEGVVEQFLQQHPDWHIQAPPADSPVAPWVTEQGWVQVWPHLHNMDGFFMVALTR